MKKTWILLLAAALLLVAFAVCAEEAVYQPKDLPVIYLNIDGGQAEIDRLHNSEDHSYKCTGTMDIAIPEGYSGEFEGRYPQENVTDLKMKYIRGRGNGTWNLPKNPYKIKFEEKQDLFGMGKSKTWVLLANYYDNSMMRNWLTEWLADQMGLEYITQGVYAEVVMNGEYLGTYYLCEQVQVGKHRVAIDELKEEDSELPEIQGGYLLEFCPDDWESVNTFETAKGLQLGNMEPSFDPEDGYQNDVQKQYIRDYIQKAEDAIYSGDWEKIGEYVDVQSLADYWWMMEFTVNADAWRTDSAHMFKKRYEADGNEGKLHFGPVWDFDESWGNAQIETMQNIGFNNATFIWADQLRTMPEFRMLLEERWQVLDAKLEEIVKEGGILDRTADIIRDSWQRDDEKWRPSKTELEMTGRSLEEEIEHIRQWTNLRREWINAHMARLGTLTFKMTVRGEGLQEETYDIPCDSTVDMFLIEDPAVEGKTFTGWVFEDGTPVGDWFIMDRDITLIAQFE